MKKFNRDITLTILWLVCAFFMAICFVVALLKNETMFAVLAMCNCVLDLTDAFLCFDRYHRNKTLYKKEDQTSEQEKDE
jgi:hypothetical protein